MDQDEQPTWDDDATSQVGPYHGRWKFRLINPGEVLEVDALVMRPGEWRGRREAGDPAWRPMDFGDLLVAVKVLC